MAIAVALLPVMVLASFDFGVTLGRKIPPQVRRAHLGVLQRPPKPLVLPRNRRAPLRRPVRRDLRRPRAVAAGKPVCHPPRRQRDLRLGRRAVLRTAGRASVWHVGGGPGDGPAGGLAAVLRRLDEQPEGSAVRGDDASWPSTISRRSRQPGRTSRERRRSRSLWRWRSP